jgi:outer membrane protein OmpA-like peptidoglycan-associated protein
MTGKSILGMALGASLLLLGAGANAAEPQPQYTVQDIQKSFTAPPAAQDDADADAGAAPAAKGACEAKGKVTGPDGLCYPNNAATAGFNLGRRATSTRPAPATASTTAPGPRTASLGTSPSAPMASSPATAPTRGHRSRRAAAAQTASGNLQRDLLITFKVGSTELTDQGRANAQVFAQALKTPELMQSKFQLSGYTDSTGASDKNMDLSQRRADALKTLLVGLGVDGARLTAKGYGAQDFLPGVPTTSPENRRVVAVKE